MRHSEAIAYAGVGISMENCFENREATACRQRPVFPSKNFSTWKRAPFVIVRHDKIYVSNAISHI